MPTGGSIESVWISGRRYGVAADAESNRKLGGFENEVEANGDGSTRLVKTRVPWLLDGLALSIDDILGDLEYLQELADTNEFFTVVIVYASGSRYTGRGQITGEVQVSSKNTIATITLQGTGDLTQL